MREDAKLPLGSIPLQDFIINAEGTNLAEPSSVLLMAESRQGWASGEESSRESKQFSKSDEDR